MTFSQSLDHRPNNGVRILEGLKYRRALAKLVTKRSPIETVTVDVRPFENRKRGIEVTLQNSRIAYQFANLLLPPRLPCRPCAARPVYWTASLST
jgi:hypothetical protein